MGSSDPLINLLKSFKYNVVRLPRAGIKPLQVLEKQGNDLSVIGDVTDLFVGGTPPAIGADEQAAFIEGKRTRGLELSVGLSLLGGIIGAMTGTKVKLDAGYKRASSLVFEFDDVKMNQVNQLALSRYLTSAKIDAAVGPPARALEEDRLYIITNTIKSKRFVTEAMQSDGKSAAIELPVIREVVGGSVGVKSEGGSTSKVTYEGETPLVFGFQAVRMEFERGAFKGFKGVKSDEAGLRGGARQEGDVEGQQPEMLETAGPFVNLTTNEDEP